MQPAIYILASKKNGTLYVGVTNNLIRRIYEHRMLNIDGFTKRYKVHTLVYYELLANMYTAISREKQIKSWSRYKKISLIESVNPNWKDLYLDITQGI